MTKLLFLLDPYLFNHQTTVVDISEVDNLFVNYSN